MRLREENEALEGEISALNERINSYIVKELPNTDFAVVFDERTDNQTLRSLCLSALDKVKTASVFGGENGRFLFVIAGEDAQNIFCKMKASLNVRGGGKEIICGTVFASESEIRAVFNGENI